jgi:hypothetical protein
MCSLLVCWRLSMLPLEFEQILLKVVKQWNTVLMQQLNILNDFDVVNSISDEYSRPEMYKSVDDVGGGSVLVLFRSILSHCN